MKAIFNQSWAIVQLDALLPLQLQLPIESIVWTIAKLQSVFLRWTVYTEFLSISEWNHVMSESAFNIHQNPLDALEVRLRIKIICFISCGPRLDLEMASFGQGTRKTGETLDVCPNNRSEVFTWADLCFHAILFLMLYKNNDSFCLVLVFPEVGSWPPLVCDRNATDNLLHRCNRCITSPWQQHA